VNGKVERRRKQDVWVKVLTFFNVLAWVIIAGIFIAVERAKPEFESFFDRFYQLDLRLEWDIKFVEYILYLTIIGLAVSAVGFFLSIARARRKDDGNRVGLLVMGVVSFVGLVCVKYYLL